MIFDLDEKLFFRNSFIHKQTNQLVVTVNWKNFQGCCLRDSNNFDIKFNEREKLIKR